MYAFQLGFPLLTASAATRLALFARRHPEKATEHISSVHGEYDGLCHFWPGAAVIAPEIARLKQLFRIPVAPFFSYIRPLTYLKPHQDGLRGGRKTSIIQPIFPLESYAPLEFWHDDGTHALTLQLSDYPAVVNLQRLHSVNNCWPLPRLNFQLSIDLPFDEVLALHQSGRLVHPAQAGS